MEKQAIEKLNSILAGIEVDKVGIVRLEDWKDTLPWNRAQDLLPGAKSIIVLAMEVFPEVTRHLTSKAQIGQMALRELYIRNVEMISGYLDSQAYKMVKTLHRLGFKGLSLTARGAPLDQRFLEGVISYKHTAQAAGLGIIGWHSLLITPEYGPRVRLSGIVTDIPLEPSNIVEMESPCPECGGACIKICPVGAITKPQKNEQYNIDKYACSTYLGASQGCGECLKVCPAGRTY